MNFISFFKNFFNKFSKLSPSSRNAEPNGRRVSFHIGINNYPGTANDLRGCVNDANNWERILREIYGFKTFKLTDRQATYSNVVKTMNRVIYRVRQDKNAHVVITFSGHGTNVRDVNGDEEDRRDEELCLYDRLLIDDELREILSKIAGVCKLTFISDSCHSGTVTRSFLNSLYEEDAPMARYLPPQDDDEAFDSGHTNVTKKIFQPVEGMNEVLLTGCRSSEYSYDAKIDGQFQGAMSAHAIKILKANPDINYADLHELIRKDLPSRRYPQTPQLEGTVENLNKKVFS